MLPGMMPTTFIPAAGGGEGNDSFTKLLIHANGSDGSTTFTDSSASAHTVTAAGNAQVDTAQSKFGGASALFDGTGDYLAVPSSSDWAFGTSTDFTIDFWIRTAAFTSNDGAFGISGVCTFQQDAASSTLKLFHAANGFSAPYVTSSTLTIGYWHHIALVRSSGTTTLYVDGTSSGSTASSLNFTAAIFYIGATHFDLSGRSISAHIDEVRISNGVARWTSAFTPPTSEYA